MKSYIDLYLFYPRVSRLGLGPVTFQTSDQQPFNISSARSSHMTISRRPACLHNAWNKRLTTIIRKHGVSFRSAILIASDRRSLSLTLTLSLTLPIWT